MLIVASLDAVPGMPRGGENWLVHPRPPPHLFPLSSLRSFPFFLSKARARMDIATRGGSTSLPAPEDCVSCMCTSYFMLSVQQVHEIIFSSSEAGVKSVSTATSLPFPKHILYTLAFGGKL